MKNSVEIRRFGSCELLVSSNYASGIDASRIAEGQILRLDIKIDQTYIERYQRGYGKECIFDDIKYMVDKIEHEYFAGGKGGVHGLATEHKTIIYVSEE